MTALADAVSWSGNSVELCLFVVWPTRLEAEIEPPIGTTAPRSVRTYRLKDEAGALAGKCVSETDLVFDEMPDDLAEIVQGWLMAAISAHALVAWFGFEGSFDFEHLLAPDVADQIFGVAARGVVALGINDHVRESQGWVRQLEAIRRPLV